MTAEHPIAGDEPAARDRTAQAGGFRCIVALSGEVASFAGDPPPPQLAPAAGAIARDADRTARHLSFTRWEAIVVESDNGLLGLAPSGQDGDELAVVGFAVETPAGAVQRAAARLAAEGIAK